MLTFLVSCETCTSIFLLSLLALLRLRPRHVSNSPEGTIFSLRGVTVAEGTDEVGVFDLLPVLLGESDSEPSSFILGVGSETHTNENKHTHTLFELIMNWFSIALILENGRNWLLNTHTYTHIHKIHTQWKHFDVIFPLKHHQSYKYATSIAQSCDQ